MSVEEHLRYALQVMDEESTKTRKDAPVNSKYRTDRYRLAEGMVQVINHIQHKKAMIALRSETGDA